MTVNQDQKYMYYKKVAWAIYSLLALVLACVLVLFVARDNEERFFYGFMTVASAYVFRPTDRFFNKLIFKFTGVSQTAEEE
jgi:lipopolysaccharide export LptBFGC system permease protein LptF